jgi:hypothetical protein
VLSGKGINLTGIRRVLALEAEPAVLRAQIDALRQAGGGSPAGTGGDPVPR